MTMTMSSTKLKLKIITRKPELSTCEIVTGPLSKDAKGSQKTELGKLKKCGISVANSDNKQQVKTIIGVKRGAEEIVNLHSKKKLKMDRSLHRKCSVILKKLMTHQCSWPFLQPVDPVSLKIPDYFSIITKPMDLGTVKSKLENNLYTVAEDFKADVRLIFSNAMRYNPPGNSFHLMAKEMDKLFSDQWRFVGSTADKQHTSDDSQRGSSLRINLGRSESLSRKPISKDLSSKNPQGQDTKHNAMICKAPKLSGSQSVSPCAKSSLHVDNSANSTRKGSTQCTERPKPKLMTESSTGSKKSVAEVAIKSKLHRNKSDPDSDGAASCLDEEHANATLPSVSQEWRSPIYEAQLSPERALRAAMLKRRFADTIFKAQQQTTLCHGGKYEDEERMRLERRQHEDTYFRIYPTERRKIEAQIKASQDRKEAERRMQRETARKSLENMQRSVEFDDNISILTELAHMIGDFSFAGPLRGYGGMYAASNQFVKGKLKSPLERLGLYLKEDDEIVCDEAAMMECEEGEFISWSRNVLVMNANWKLSEYK
ncbi:uncharacterized protein [Phyllobates terribilis]|uniref:uncharacterized protein n=1 Tax=Phyllobates terribilis TaxID=111132 RepID=UPI003CCB432C